MSIIARVRVAACAEYCWQGCIVAIMLLLGATDLGYAQPFSRPVVLRSPDDPKIHSTSDHFGWSIIGIRRSSISHGPLVALGSPSDYQDAHQGLVYLYRAATGEFMGTLRAPRLDTTGQFARSLAALGDLDADGFDEILIGAPLESAPGGPGGEGAAYVWPMDLDSGPIRIAPPAPRVGGAFADSITKIPDIDGDGLSEIGVGASRDVWLFTGALRRHFLTLPGAGMPAYSAVMRVLGITDVDDDSAGDVVVNALRSGINLPLDCYSGATGGLLWATQFQRFVRLSPTDDFDQDGVADIIVGCELCEVDGLPDLSGFVSVVSGMTGEVIRTFLSPRPVHAGSFGSAVASYRDLDGDGLAELVVGARIEEGPDGVRTGAAYIISSGTGEVLQTFFSPRSWEYGYFGSGVAIVPDANGDGREEIAVSAPSEMLGLPGRQAYVFLSCRVDYNADLRIDSADFFDFLGAFFAGAADYNVDGQANSQDFFDFLSEFFAGCS